MAKKDDNENFLNIMNDDSLKQQAETAKEYAKDVADFTEQTYKSASEKISDKLKKELTPLQKAILTAQSNLNESNKQRLNIKENVITGILNQTGKGQKYSVDTASVVRDIGKEVVKLVGSSLTTLFVKPVTKAVSEMSNAYEANFTAIAGRMDNTRKGTYDLMKKSVQQLNDSSFKTAVNANTELIPELAAVAQRGFKNDEAVSTALSNAIDKKIMPWLDTASESWTNLQYNLTQNQLNSLKGQQLLLQETRSGNRLLQSGVVNTLTGDLSYMLANIEYNTFDREKADEELTDLMDSLIQNAHYTPAQAYKEAQQMIRIQKNPLDAIVNGGNVAEKIMGMVAANGGSFYDQAKTKQYFINQGAAMSNDLSAGAWAQHITGTAPDDTANVKGFRAWAKGYKNYDGKIEGNNTADTTNNRYNNALVNAGDKVTVTQAHDNYWGNTATDIGYFLNNAFPHAVEIAQDVASSVKSILGLLAAYGVGKLATSLISNSGGKLFNKLGGKLFKDAGKELTKSVSEEASKQAMRHARPPSAVSVIGNSAGAAASAALTYANVKDFYDSSELKKVRGQADSVKKGATGAQVASGIGAAAGVAGTAVFTGALVAGASVPVIGWALAGIAALGLGTSKAVKYFTQLGGVADNTRKAFNELIDVVEKDANDTYTAAHDLLAAVSNLTDSAEDENKARSLVVNAGIATEEEANGMHIDQLKNLTSEYESAVLKFKNMPTDYLELIQSDAVEKNKKESKTMIGDLSDHIKNEYFKGSRGTNIGYKKGSSEYNELEALLKELAENASGDKADELRAKIDKAFDDKITKKEIDSIVGNTVGALFGFDKVNLKSTEVGLVGQDLNDANLGKNKFSDTSITIYDPSNYADQTASIKSFQNAYAKYLANKSDNNKESVMKAIEDMKTSGIKKKDLERVPTLSEAISSLKDDGFKIPQYKTGIDYVSDPHVAVIDHGEAVLTETENEYRIKGLKADRDAALKSLKLVDEPIKALQNYSKYASDTIYTLADSINSKNDNSELVEILKKILSVIQGFSSSRNSADNYIKDVFKSNAAMSPRTANTRNIYSV